MDWVRNTLGGGDDEINPLIGSIKLDNMLLGTECIVTLDDLLESWVRPVGNKGGSCHAPFEEIVGSCNSNGEVILAILAAGIQGEDRNEVGGLIVASIRVGVS